MIATGSLSMTADLENSTSMILIVDAGSVKRGNFTGAILTVGVDSIMVVISTAGVGLITDEILTTGADSGRIGAAILTAVRRIAAEDIKATEVVGAITDAGKSKVG